MIILCPFLVSSNLCLNLLLYDQQAICLIWALSIRKSCPLAIVLCTLDIIIRINAFLEKSQASPFSLNMLHSPMFGCQWWIWTLSFGRLDINLTPFTHARILSLIFPQYHRKFWSILCFQEMVVNYRKKWKNKTPDHVMNARAPRSCKLLPAI